MAYKFTPRVRYCPHCKWDEKVALKPGQSICDWCKQKEKLWHA